MVKIKTNCCKPFGNIEKARVLVIGHDPMLQNSNAQAQFAFFLNYLRNLPPANPSEKRKYSLASSVVSYIKYLGGSLVLLKNMYFTNLCNEFLDRPIGGGTVLIADEAADKGIQAIEDTLSRGSFKVILPMTPQVFYHLVRTGFVSDSDEILQAFLRRAQPKPTAKERKAYEPTARSPFLLVCGQEYCHRNDHIPIIPIVHIRQWPLNSKMKPRYEPLMEEATKNIHDCLRSAMSRNGVRRISRE